ncbi:putative Protein transport protein SEC24 [Blattamonas nauphoetae]|uniref:Uncharacterized protein n=1 Tax=Blattamonas nauphoetae TaxID=2049346 RepID=A0ABQ9WSL6_9EUKA|nr:putative Protein transport protein SEC24 [Blattamonas nauphoetae]
MSQPSRRLLDPSLSARTAEDTTTPSFQQPPSSFPPQPARTEPNHLSQPTPFPTTPSSLSSSPSTPVAIRPTQPGAFDFTLSAAPRKPSVLKKWPIPFGVTVNPFAGYTVQTNALPFVSFHPVAPIRCKRCRTFINAGVSFTSKGRNWTCNLCGLENVVFQHYYCALDPTTQQRTDLSLHPELNCMSYGLTVPPSYRATPPHPFQACFLVDITPSAVKRGVSLSSFKISFGEDIQLPVPENKLIVPLMKIEKQLSKLLHTGISSLLNDRMISNQDDSVFGSALTAAKLMTKNTGGHIICFLGTRPSVDPGSLEERPDFQSQPDKLFTRLQCNSEFYKEFAYQFVQSWTTVNIFAFPCQDLDTASLSILPELTGGSLFLFPTDFPPDPPQSFTAPSLPLSIHRQVHAHLSSIFANTVGYECSLTVRTHNSIKVDVPFGHVYQERGNVVKMGCFNRTHRVSFQLLLDSRFITSQRTAIPFQVHVAFTTATGQRLVIIHNYNLPLFDHSPSPSDPLGAPSMCAKHFSPTGSLSLLAKMSAFAGREQKATQVKADLLDKMKTFFKTISSSVNSPYSPFETFSSFFASINGLLRGDLLQDTNYMEDSLQSPSFSVKQSELRQQGRVGVRYDLRTSFLHHALTLDSSQLATFLTPVLLNITLSSSDASSPPILSAAQWLMNESSINLCGTYLLLTPFTSTLFLLGEENNSLAQAGAFEGLHIQEGVLLNSEQFEQLQKEESSFRMDEWGLEDSATNTDDQHSSTSPLGRRMLNMINQQRTSHGVLRPAPDTILTGQMAFNQLSSLLSSELGLSLNGYTNFKSYIESAR